MIPEVMGIDPSLRATGLCFPDGSTAVIKTGEADRGDTRLWDLGRQLRYYLRAWPCVLAVLEVPTQFKSGDAALAAGMVQGICRLLLVEFQVPFAKINPQLVKKFALGTAGGPASDKAHMVAACNRHRQAAVTTFSNSGETATTIYPDAITDDNMADAWWLRQMGLWRLGIKQLDFGQDPILNPGIIRDAAVKDSKGAKWPGVSAIR